MEWSVASLIALGDLDRAGRELEEVRALAGRLRQPFMLHVAEHYASTLALCTGRLAEADAAAQRSHEWSLLLTDRPASGIHGIQMFGIRREQGRLSELAPVTRLFAASDRLSGAWRPGLAALLAELGMEAEARRELNRVREEGFDSLRSGIWLASLTYLTDACAAVGDEPMAALIYPELNPLAERRTWSSAMASPATGPPIAISGCWPRRLAITGWRSSTSSTRWHATGRWARQPGPRTRCMRMAERCGCGGTRTMAPVPSSSCRRRRRWPSGSGCQPCWRGSQALGATAAPVRSAAR